MLTEICCDGLDAAKNAVQAGARRVELCSDLSAGGITPPYSEIEAAAALEAKVNVLIRPRSGNFVYSIAEADKMMREIAFCGTAGVNGIVVGALCSDYSVDMRFCREFIAMARSYGLSVTFHRAVDEALLHALGGRIPSREEDFDNAAKGAVAKIMADIIALTPDRILTSGGAPTAFEGRFVIREMRRLAGSEGPLIMPGGGVTSENAEAIISASGVSEIHGSRLSLLGLQA